MIDSSGICRKSVLAEWNSAIENGKFLADKHKVETVGSGSAGYRTVVLKSEESLAQYINTGKYNITLYDNKEYPKSPYYYQVTPCESGIVTGSGIKPYTGTLIDSCDCFVVVIGRNQGPHIYAEQACNISERQQMGSLELVKHLD